MAGVSVGSIDTESIITQLMTVERAPQDLMKTNVTNMQTQQNAWQAIADKLTALQTASDALGGFNTLASLTSVSSSDSTSVAVTSTGPGTPTSATVDVIALAATQSVLVSDTFASTTDSIGSRTLQLTNASGASQTITSADGTIGGLATAINNAGLGVSARILQTAPGQFQLSLTSVSTGTANSFTAAGTGWGTFTTVRPPADAQIQIDGVTLTRSTNIINDAIDGVSLSLLKPTTSSVTVSSAQDTSTIVSKVQALVDAANAVGSIITQATAIGSDPTTNGPLAGDYSAGAFMDSVRNAIAQPLTSASGKTMTSNALGISLNKDGTIAFDSSALLATLATNPSDVIAALGQSASSTAPGVSVIGSTTGAKPGNHTIVVTQAALQSTLTGSAVALPAASTAESLTFTGANGAVNVSFSTGATWAQTVSNLNTAMRAAGVAITATVQTVGGVDQGINLTENKWGTQSTTIAGGDDLGITGTTAGGANAQGTFDGTAFTATGRSYAVNGLVLSITTTPDQLTALGGTSTGTVSFTQGLAGALSAIGAQGGDTGPAEASKAMLQSQIDDLNTRIADFDTYLSNYEDTIRTKFTAMQTMLTDLQSMQSSVNSMTASASS